MTVVTLRHGMGWVATLTCAVAGALLALTAPAGERLPTALLAAGVTALVGLVGAYPVVVLDERGVLVRNPWRTHRISWPALEDEGFGWALWVRPRGRSRVRAVAAPGPARMRSLYEFHWTQGGVMVRDATSARTPVAPAQLAVEQSRERWGRSASDEGTRTTRSPGGLALTAVGVVALAAGLALV